MFFFEKKNQKTFATWPRRFQQPRPIDKSFLVLFFKKELLAFFLLAGTAQAELPPGKITISPQAGEAAYSAHCATCHDHAAGRVPPKDVIANNTAAFIYATISDGIMQSYAQRLDLSGRLSLAVYVSKNRGGGTVDRASAEVPACTDKPASLSLDGPGWNGWGRDAANSRFQPVPGLSAADVPRLKLKWAIGLNGARNGQPVVVGGRLYTDNSAGEVYALNAATGCSYWRFSAARGSRNTIAIAPIPPAARAQAGGAAAAAYFVDEAANLYAIDADSGRQLWKTKIDQQQGTQFTGSVAAAGGLVYVPVSSMQEYLAQSDSYPCCKFRGAIVAVDGATGRIVWTTYTVARPATPTRLNASGTQMWGPSGSAIWSAPTIDAKRGVLYAATGDSYVREDNEGADAIIAMDLHSGAIRWTRQLRPHDDYIIGCYGPRAHWPANCPDKPGADADFGSSPILQSLPDGHDVLVAAQKSSQVYGLDPDAQGRVVWTQRLSQGGPLGGIEFGPAADGQAVYAGVADIYAPDPKPGLSALRLNDGKVLWTTPSPKLGCRWTNEYCNPAVSMAVTAIPGIAFAGAMNGRLRAYAVADGHVVWEADTGAAPYRTVAGKQAMGGVLDASGPVVAGGVVYVHSGYASRSGPGGTVLLAYSVDGK